MCTEKTHCPKCGSRLFKDDKKYIDATGVCSYCPVFLVQLVGAKVEYVCKKCLEEKQKKGEVT